MAIRNEVIRAPSNTVQIVIMVKDAAPRVFRVLTGATKTQQDTPERFRSGNQLDRYEKLLECEALQ